MNWDIWAEGNIAGTHKATKLNTKPVKAPTFNDAIEKLADSHPERHLFEKTNIGWTYKGCLMFDTEIAARVSLG